ncbi:minor capsid protein [Clostridium sp.]|uniref:minor capsid protein n=1 Tax=Clostridium sp. TaxID=1506 RepID=UPI001D3AB7F0|nr:minor capsid protein [Clostridium sp.]MBS5937753.1 minor capsid protein [Clostridium sp.]
MKLNQNQKLAKDITEKLNEELYNLSDTEAIKILKLHKDNRDEILNEIAKIMLSYNIKDDSLNIADSEKIKLTKKIQDKVNTIFKNETKEEVKNVTEILKKITLDKYYSNSYVMSLGLDFTLKKVTNKQLNRIINKTVEGKLYSDRIWSNKNVVAKTIKLEVKKFLNGETNLNNIEKIIKDKYNSNAFNTKRLIRTETARVMEQANEKFAEDHNVEYQLFSATLDDRTSEICSGLDGQVFRYDDTNKPVCPLHPNCRSTLISLPSKDYRPKTRLNNITKERISYKTYQDWKVEQDL